MLSWGLSLKCCIIQKIDGGLLWSRQLRLADEISPRWPGGQLSIGGGQSRVCFYTDQPADKSAPLTLLPSLFHEPRLQLAHTIFTPQNLRPTCFPLLICLLFLFFLLSFSSELWQHDITAWTHALQYHCMNICLQYNVFRKSKRKYCSPFDRLESLPRTHILKHIWQPHVAVAISEAITQP